MNENQSEPRIVCLPPHEKPHIAKSFTDNCRATRTWCGLILRTVGDPPDKTWSLVCQECKEERAIAAGKKVYETPKATKYLPGQMPASEVPILLKYYYFAGHFPQEKTQ